MQLQNGTTNNDKGQPCVDLPSEKCERGNKTVCYTLGNEELTLMLHSWQ